MVPTAQRCRLPEFNDAAFYDVPHVPRCALGGCDLGDAGVGGGQR